MAGRLTGRAPRLHRFLTRRDRPWPLVREALGFLAGIALLFALLYGLTGQPLRGGTPVVVVTTGSMMHCTNYPERASVLGSGCDPERWGRVGVIDPGDLIFVHRVDGAGEVTTRAEDGGGHYGRPGDVIVYRRNGNAADTPIIHRALFWVQVNPDGTFSVPAVGLHGSGTLDVPPLRTLTGESGGCDPTAAFAPRPGDAGRPPEARSGFVTRGDNNAMADQCSGGWLPARMQWVVGKARGEVPWVGLVNLWWNDVRNGSNDFGHAGSDSKAMFFAVLATLVAAPWAVEAAVRRRRRHRRRGQGAAGPDGGDGDAGGPGPGEPGADGPGGAPDAGGADGGGTGGGEADGGGAEGGGAAPRP